MLSLLNAPQAHWVREYINQLTRAPILEIKILFGVNK